MDHDYCRRVVHIDVRVFYRFPRVVHVQWRVLISASSRCVYSCRRFAFGHCRRCVVSIHARVSLLCITSLQAITINGVASSCILCAILTIYASFLSMWAFCCPASSRLHPITIFCTISLGVPRAIIIMLVLFPPRF